VCLSPAFRLSRVIHLPAEHDCAATTRFAPYGHVTWYMSPAWVPNSFAFLTMNCVSCADPGAWRRSTQTSHRATLLAHKQPAKHKNLLSGPQQLPSGVNFASCGWATRLDLGQSVHCRSEAPTVMQLTVPRCSKIMAVPDQHLLSICGLASADWCWHRDSCLL
jgi:hypothetical protein